MGGDKGVGRHYKKIMVGRPFGKFPSRKNSKNLPSGGRPIKKTTKKFKKYTKNVLIL
ncbi:MAG: hypothetical protein LBP62_02570 [Clostridiales bacterium]|nr:hypothetical protein [Clostridiales bacterium]